MSDKLLSALVGLSMLGLVVAANATESVILTDAEMDGVTAGASSVDVPHPAAVHNPNTAYDAGTPGSSDFLVYIYGEPEGAGHFPEARYHNHSGN